MRFHIALLVCVLCAALCAHAKGSPDLIVISGGGLLRPVEITDPASLRAFTPWNGQFADWKQPTVDEPLCYRRSYEVLFFMKWPGRQSPLDRGDLKLIYATRYCSDGAAAGYVYLYANDEGPHMNMGTIILPGRDGKWSRSTPAWDTLLRNALALKEQAAQVDMIRITGGDLKSAIEIADAEVLRNFDPWSAKFVDWERAPGTVVCGWEYEVQFLRRGVQQKTPYDQPGFHFLYALRFCFDKNGGPGYVHLAGRNDTFGMANAASVWDARHAGRWYRATTAWNRFLWQTVSPATASTR